MTDIDKELRGHILSNELFKLAIAELRLQDETPETQEEVLSEVADTVLKRVIFELLNRVPKSDENRLQALMEARDHTAIIELFRSHVSDLDEFVKIEALKEFQAIKTA